MISSMINKGLIRRDRIFNFSVNIPDKPGELAKVVDLISFKIGENNLIKIFIFSKAIQSLNVTAFIFSKPSGNSTFFKLEHS